MDHFTPRPREIALERLQAYILEHNLQPGEALPPERDLCQAWGINRTTLRSAISRMEASGRLFAVQGSGTRLMHRLQRSPENLSSFAKAAFSSGFRPDTRILSIKKTACSAFLSRYLRKESGETLYEICRLRLLDEAPALADAAYLPADLLPGLEDCDLQNRSLFQILKENYHFQLRQSTVKISLTHVTEEEGALLELPAGSAAFQIVTVTEDTDGTPIEYCRTIGRADKLELTAPLYWADTEDGRI
ncbi:MAG: GntR family transcriptional regulator [Oscillospiraceae bacterium]|nr:GntR family transcriptional regulator [Oscillospiraceae bacterium]